MPLSAWLGAGLEAMQRLRVSPEPYRHSGLGFENECLLLSSPISVPRPGTEL